MLIQLSTSLCIKLKLSDWEGQDDVAFCHITGPSPSNSSCSNYRYTNLRVWNLKIYFFLELRTSPTLKSRLHPIFVRECTEAIRKCENLKRFLCTVSNLFAVFLPSLQQKSRLKDLRIYANLTTDQAKMLTNFEKLRSLSLEFATWNVAAIFPSWAEILQKTLTRLTLYVSFYAFCCFFPPLL